MVLISDLMDIAELQSAVDQGYVRIQVHPFLPYKIYNYTDACTFDRAWTDVTRQCRGLIVHEDGTVLARPFSKFFNYGEHPEGALDLNAPTEVTDKIDGSLGILHPVPDGWAVATRGSFTSEQALHATNILQVRYADFQPPDDVTILCEIIYPGNRIVVDYGLMDDLVLLGGIHIKTGASVPVREVKWAGPRVTQFEAATLADALSLPPRVNAEGVVVRLLDSNVRIKIKQDDYVALHRILTQVTARNIWEFLAVNACKYLVGETILKPAHWGTYVGIDPARASEILATGDNWRDHLLEGVPDEFHAWLHSVIDGITGKVESLRLEATTTMEQLKAKYGTDRRGFAAEARKSPVFGFVFHLYDDRDITAGLWKVSYPPAGRPFADHGEDIA